jgi:hypothetical protein
MPYSNLKLLHHQGLVAVAHAYASHFVEFVLILTNPCSSSASETQVSTGADNAAGEKPSHASDEHQTKVCEMPYTTR